MSSNDLPVVDPTTGLVDPDEVIVVTQRLRDEGWLPLSLDHIAEYREQLDRLRTELAAMAEKLRQAEAERDEARADLVAYRADFRSWFQLAADLRRRLAAYERLVTAARALASHGPLGVLALSDPTANIAWSFERDRRWADLHSAIAALPPEGPVEAPTDALQPRTDEMP